MILRTDAAGHAVVIGQCGGRPVERNEINLLRFEAVPAGGDKSVGDPCRTLDTFREIGVGGFTIRLCAAILFGGPASCAASREHITIGSAYAASVDERAQKTDPVRRDCNAVTEGIPAKGATSQASSIPTPQVADQTAARPVSQPPDPPLGPIPQQPPSAPNYPWTRSPVGPRSPGRPPTNGGKTYPRTTAPGQPRRHTEPGGTTPPGLTQPIQRPPDKPVFRHHAKPGLGPDAQQRGPVNGDAIVPFSAIFGETPATAKALSGLGTLRIVSKGRTLFTFPTTVGAGDQGLCDRSVDESFTFRLNDPRRLGDKVTTIVLYWSAIKYRTLVGKSDDESISGWSKGYVSITSNGYTDSYWIRPVMPTLPNRTIEIQVPADHVREDNGLTITIHSDTEHRGKSGCLALLLEALEIKVEK